jgi:uncharacterized membrane protein
VFERMHGVEPVFGHFLFGGWIGLILLVLVVGLVTWLVARAVIGRAPGGPGGTSDGLDEADAILRARLARGEISAEEYAETRRVLGLK